MLQKIKIVNAHTHTLTQTKHIDIDPKGNDLGKAGPADAFPKQYAYNIYSHFQKCFSLHALASAEIASQ